MKLYIYEALMFIDKVHMPFIIVEFVISFSTLVVIQLSLIHVYMVYRAASTFNS